MFGHRDETTYSPPVMDPMVGDIYFDGDEPPEAEYWLPVPVA